jgi:transcriptional regulator
MRETISAYESSFAQPWPGELPEDYRDKMIQGIVAFEMPVNRVEAKFKLGQNRPAADSQSVFEALSRATDHDSRALAELMIIEGHARVNEK